MSGNLPIRIHSFDKSERLCNHTLIKTLFTKGSHFSIYPIRVYWMECDHDQPAPVQVLVQVQRKHFRYAVKRNLLKRRIREAYRRNKTILTEKLARHGRKAVFALVYYGNSILAYRKLEPIIIVILQRLSREYEKDSG